MPFRGKRPGRGPLFSPLRLALLLTALDFAWAAQAMTAAPRHFGSNVAMVSLVVWLVLHLPAALLVGLLLRVSGGPQGPQTPVPFWAMALMVVLGLTQTFTVAYGLAKRSRHRRA